MEPSTVQPVTPLDSNAVSSKKNMRGLIISVAIVIIFLLGAWGYKHFVIDAVKLNKEAQILSEVRMDSEEDFSPTGYKKYIAGIDASLAEEGISQDTRNTLLYKKAVMMLNSQEPNEAAREALRNEGGAILKELYNLSDTDEKTRKLKGEITANYLLYFNQLFWMPSNTNFLPEKYSKEYIDTVATDTASQDVTNKYERLAFKAHVALAKDSNLEELALDRTLLANRAYLIAGYLDTYYDKISPEERNSLQSQLKADIIAFRTSINIIFNDRIHYILNTFYYAYAYDVYAKLVPNDDIIKPSEVVAQYETARANISVNGDFAESNATIGQYIDAYYLSYLVEKKSTVDKSKINELVKELDVLSENKASGNVMWYFYRTLRGRRSDTILRTSLKKLSLENKDYEAYLRKINVIK